MEDETMNQFTDDLLKEKTFNCQICDELCTSDIFLVKGKGYVCGKCLEEKCGEEMKSKAELITRLMSIMAKLMLPCKFQSKGCDKRVESKKYSKHIGTCDFKIKPCPMKNLEGCDWSGSDFEVSGHLLKKHEEHVIKGENNIFKVKTSLGVRFNVKILSNDYQSCLLKTSVVDDKFYYALNPVGKSEENMEYTVVHKSTPEQNNKELKTLGTLTKLNGFYDEENLDKNPNATVVDINLLKHLADKDNMISNEFNLNPKGIDENLLKLLECPVCMSVMRPPIHQCNRGHSICIICRGKVSACPTCNGEWTNARNFFMENFTTNLKYPCRFKKSGCKENAIEGDIKKHEEICLFYSCKSAFNNIAIDEQSPKCLSQIACRFYSFGCKERGVKREIIKHEESCGFYRYKCPLCPQFLRKDRMLKHAEDLHKIINVYSSKFSKVAENDEIYVNYMAFDLNLFRISYYAEDIYVHFAVELICSNENPSLYTYEITFSNHNAERPLILKSTCVEEMQRGYPTPEFVKILNDNTYNKFDVSIKKAN